MDILKDTKKMEEILIKIRRDLHKIPEIGLELPQTYKYITELLAEKNIPFRSYLNKNGISCDIYGKKPGANIAVRCDMDALSINEETNLPFKSENGNMHACGHDAHMAIAITTMLICNEYKDELPGMVRFIFQPGEEYPGGAKPMIEEGVLSDPQIENIIGLHVGAIFPNIPFGKIGVKNGEIMASMDKFEVTVTGRGGHGSMPEATIDPIPALCDICGAIDRIKSREISPNDRVAISVCHVEAGSTQNIIPTTAYLEGTVRCYSDKVREHIRDRIGEIAEDVAKAYRCQCNYEYSWKYPAVINDLKSTDLIRDCVKDVLKEEPYEIENPSMTGEDMSFYLNEIGGTFFMLSNLEADENGKTYINHNSKFMIAESELYKGVAVFLAYIEKYNRHK